MCELCAQTKTKHRHEARCLSISKRANVLYVSTNDTPRFPGIQAIEQLKIKRLSYDRLGVRCTNNKFANITNKQHPSLHKKKRPFMYYEFNTHDCTTSLIPTTELIAQLNQSEQHPRIDRAIREEHSTLCGVAQSSHGWMHASLQVKTVRTTTVPTIAGAGRTFFALHEEASRFARLKKNKERGKRRQVEISLGTNKTRRISSPTCETDSPRMLAVCCVVERG